MKLKKLNNKGVTLVELIVSFALVSVAIIYFYQTLYTVNKLYNKSRNETNEFVQRTYASKIISELNKSCLEDYDNYETCMKKLNLSDFNVTDVSYDKYQKIKFKISDSDNLYKLYFYNSDTYYKNLKTKIEKELSSKNIDEIVSSNVFNFEEFSAFNEKVYYLSPTADELINCLVNKQKSTDEWCLRNNYIMIINMNIKQSKTCYIYKISGEFDYICQDIKS